MKILDAVRTAAETLEKAGIDDPLADAEILAYHAATLNRMTAFIDNPEISKQTLAMIRRLAARRAQGEPVQYIVGNVEFCGLTIHVGKGVLIPRPETELLVEEAIKTVKSEMLYVNREKADSVNMDSDLTHQSSLSFLDLCTGSGCIALALAREFQRAEVVGTDISQKALRHAKKNADANSIGNITFRKGSLFEPIEQGMMFDLITANPPYIRRDEIAGLQREVRDWEPVSALEGGPDGLDFYRKILGKATGYLKSGGSIIMELGFGQAEAVLEIAGKHGLSDAVVIDDFAGIRRILKAKL
jgi:release factor glutamine methyltransferase